MEQFFFRKLTSAPAAGDTIAVYAAGTPDLVELAGDNPFVIASADEWSFAPASMGVLYDVFWVEGNVYLATGQGAVDESKPAGWDAAKAHADSAHAPANATAAGAAGDAHAATPHDYDAAGMAVGLLNQHRTNDQHGTTAGEQAAIAAAAAHPASNTHLTATERAAMSGAAAPSATRPFATEGLMRRVAPTVLATDLYAPTLGGLNVIPLSNTVARAIRMPYPVVGADQSGAGLPEFSLGIPYQAGNLLPTFEVDIREPYPLVWMTGEGGPPTMYQAGATTIFHFVFDYQYARWLIFELGTNVFIPPNYREKRHAETLTGSIVLDLDKGSVQAFGVQSNSVVQMPNYNPGNYAVSVVLIVKHLAAAAFSLAGWNNNLIWLTSDGLMPALNTTVGKVNIITLLWDAGTQKWLAMLAGKEA